MARRVRSARRRSGERRGLHGLPRGPRERGRAAHARRAALDARLAPLPATRFAQRSLPPMGSADDLPQIPFASATEWEEWLEENHAASDGVWIKMAKKGAGIESVRYPEVLDTALCFGWIDGRREALDERFFLQRFTPRRPRSRWSRINRDKAERLISEGRMRRSGLAEVERAKADGRWEAAYESQARSRIPEDLQRELDARPAART